MTIANLAGTGCPAMIARTMFSEIDLDLKLQFCLSISSVLLSFGRTFSILTVRDGGL
jgi:hypothetical protein